MYCNENCNNWYSYKKEQNEFVLQKERKKKSPRNSNRYQFSAINKCLEQPVSVKHGLFHIYLVGIEMAQKVKAQY